MAPLKPHQRIKMSKATVSNLRLERVSPTEARLTETCRKVTGSTHEFTLQRYTADTAAELDAYIAENLAHLPLVDVQLKARARVLTPEQAQPLYLAMLHCNDINASFRFNVQHADGSALIVEDDPESWSVNIKIADGTIVEHYENQAAFATDYGIAI